MPRRTCEQTAPEHKLVLWQDERLDLEINAKCGLIAGSLIGDDRYLLPSNFASAVLAIAIAPARRQGCFGIVHHAPPKTAHMIFSGIIPATVDET